MDRLTVLYQRLVNACNALTLKYGGMKRQYVLRDKWGVWYRRTSATT